MTGRQPAGFYYDRQRGKVRPIMKRRGGSSTFSRGGHKYVVKVKPSKPALDQAKDLERAKTEIKEAKEDVGDAQAALKQASRKRGQDKTLKRAKREVQEAKQETAEASQAVQEAAEKEPPK